MNILKRSLVIIQMLGGVFSSALVLAQTEDISSLSDYKTIEKFYIQFNSINPSLLLRINEDNISYAQAVFEKSKGDFINYYQSNNSYIYGAEAKSFFRYNDRIIFKGEISYTNFYGKNMSGSTFIDPYHSPFDIVEIDETTSGDKKAEIYNINGSVAASIYKGLSLGISLDLMASNYAKMKDLRHRNKLSDLTFSPGISYSFTPYAEIGTSFIYRKRVEGQSFNVYGTTDIQYKTFINYGGFIGKNETFGDTGYTNKNEEKPLVDIYKGLSLQFRGRLYPILSYYLEGSYFQRDGYYGVKSPSSVVYSNHNSKTYDLKVTLMMSVGNSKHSILFNAVSESLTNYESVYKNETQPGGASNIIYYDNVERCKRDNNNLNLSYKGDYKFINKTPLWSMEINMSRKSKDIIASVYPYYRKQNIVQNNISTVVEKNLIYKKSILTFSLGTGYGKGSGNIFKDGLYTSLIGEAAPATIENYLYKEFEYLTTPRFNAMLGVKYSLLIKNDLRLYFSLDYDQVYACKTEYLKSDKHHYSSLSIGCCF